MGASNGATPPYKIGADGSGNIIADPDIFAPNPELPRNVDSYIRQ